VVHVACSSLPAANAMLASSVAACQNPIYNILNHQWRTERKWTAKADV